MPSCSAMTCGIWIARLKPWMMTLSRRPFCANAGAEGSATGDSAATPAAPTVPRNCLRVALIPALPIVLILFLLFFARLDVRALFQAVPDVAAQVEKFRRALDVVAARAPERHMDHL